MLVTARIEDDPKNEQSNRSDAQRVVIKKALFLAVGHAVVLARIVLLKMGGDA
jgi:hypothetical protein